MVFRQTRLNRRNVLKGAGGVVVGAAALSQVGKVSAQNATASITINDQESTGDSVVIASLQTDVDARLYITPTREEDDNLIHKQLDLSAGTSFENRTVQLDRPIEESKVVSAVIQAGPNYQQLIADDAALIAVGKSLEAAQRDRRTGYNTPPGVQKIEKDPDAGFHSPYFLYTPETPDSAELSVNNSTERPLLVQVYSWGDFENRVNNAREGIQNGILGADKTNCPALFAPLYFRVGSGFGLQSGTEISDPQRQRVDRQLLAMIEDAKSRLNGDTYTVADQIQFAGGSSTGVFIDRFAALHPEQVRVFSSGANGIAFLPLAELTDDIPTYGDPEQTTVPWPIGVADFTELVGREFNRDAWMNINQYRWIGENDQDPQNPREYVHKIYRGDNEISNLVRDIFGSLQVDHRFETSRQIYNHLGVPATFTVFEGTGHVPKSEHFQMIENYHQQQVVEDFEVVHLIPHKSASTIQTGDSVTVTVTAENPTPFAASTTITFGVDGTTVKTVEREISPQSTSEITFTRTFDEPGTYSLTVNEQLVDDRPVTVVEPTATPTASPTPNETTEATGPGFGIGATVASVAGLGYLFTHHEKND